MIKTIILDIIAFIMGISGIVFSWNLLSGAERIIATSLIIIVLAISVVKLNIMKKTK